MQAIEFYSVFYYVPPKPVLETVKWKMNKNSSPLASEMSVSLDIFSIDLTKMRSLLFTALTSNIFLILMIFFQGIPPVQNWDWVFAIVKFHAACIFDYSFKSQKWEFEGEFSL